MATEEVGTGEQEAPFPTSPLVAKDRLTMILDLHHEHYGDAPHSLGHTVVERYLDTQEQVWVRRIQIGEKLQPLDLGWFSDKPIGAILLLNNEGKGLLTNPTLEQKQATAAKIIEVVTGDGPVHSPLLVYPGWPFLFSPLCPRGIMVRCQSGIATCWLRVFPG